MLTVGRLPILKRWARVTLNSYTLSWERMTFPLGVGLSVGDIAIFLGVQCEIS